MSLVNVHKIFSILRVSIFIFSSQVGSGFFILPSLLSVSGYWSILALAAVGLCAILTINIFAQSEKNIRELIMEGFGERISKILFFVYWFISWFSTIVLFKELVGYWGCGSAYSFYVEFGVWLIITLINMWKLEYTLYIESVLTLMKMLPFFILMFCYFMRTSTPSIITFQPIKIGLLVRCVWCFVGLETGSIVGNSLKVSSKEKKIGTYVGIFSVVIFYLLSIVFSFNIVGNEILLNNRAPYLTILQKGLEKISFITNIGVFVKSLIVVALIGSINSWTINSGYTADECGKNGILPKFLAVQNRHKVPYMGVFFSSVLVLIFLIICRSNDIYKIITLSIDVSCCFFLAIYGVCLIAYSKVYSKKILHKICYALLGLLFLCIFLFELKNFF